MHTAEREFRGGGRGVPGGGWSNTRARDLSVATLEASRSPVSRYYRNRLRPRNPTARTCPPSESSSATPRRSPNPPRRASSCSSSAETAAFYRLCCSEASSATAVRSSTHPSAAPPPSASAAAGSLASQARPAPRSPSPGTSVPVASWSPSPKRKRITRVSVSWRNVKMFWGIYKLPESPLPLNINKAGQIFNLIW